MAKKQAPPSKDSSSKESPEEIKKPITRRGLFETKKCNHITGWGKIPIIEFEPDSKSDPTSPNLDKKTDATVEKDANLGEVKKLQNKQG